MSGYIVFSVMLDGFPLHMTAPVDGRNNKNDTHNIKNIHPTNNKC